MDQHPLAKQLQTAFAAVYATRSKTAVESLSRAVTEVCEYLNKRFKTISKMQAAARASGKSGRKKKEFDTDLALKMLRKGASNEEIGKAQGCHATTVHMKLKDCPADIVEAAKKAGQQARDRAAKKAAKQA
jgi:hypothetical protein